MFICGLSGVVSKPNEKPVQVILEERPVTYTYLDAEGEPVSSYGREIVKEVAARIAVVDSEKAARIEAARCPIDIQVYAAQSKARFTHAAGCKKSLDDCHTCQKNIEFFSQLPLRVLSTLTEERRVRS